MKRAQDTPDLYEMAEPQLAERLMPRTSAASSIHTSRPIHSSGYDRKVLDFYATPDWVTEALLRHIQFRGRVWEPCCGTGAITTVLQRHGYDVTSTDIADRGFGTPGVDFLLCQTVPEGCQALVTNPPYGTDTPPYKGQEKSAMAMLRFVDHALRLTGSVQGQLALLVRFQWVAGKRAAALMSAGPFSAVIALTRRIQWFDRGEATNISQHQPGAMGGREGEFEAMRGLLRDPGRGLFGDVRGMIVEDQLDRGVGRIGGIEELEEFESSRRFRGPRAARTSSRPRDRNW